MNTSNEIVLIPLNKLVRSPHNVRKTGDNGIDELAASILAHGLLHNLVATKGKGDKHEVIAGGRRLAALEKLAKDKKIPRTFGVPCRVVTSGNSTATSLAENVVREDMHPADQFEAFRLMIDQGAGIEEVVARFGVSVTAVRQRLRLAHVSPNLVGLYRVGKITLDQLMALAVTEDHAAQERVWGTAQGWQRNPDSLRRLLTDSMVDASTDPRARFVGIQAYVDAGGQIERDLFQPNHEGYLTDPGKLEELAVAKLEEVANETRTEGWSWVEIVPFGQQPEVWRFGRISVVRAPANPEAQAEIDTLEAEQDKLRSEYEECEEYPEAVDERLSAIDKRLDALNVIAETYREEDKKLAGAFISVGHDGKPSVYRGLVRRADKKKVRAAAAGSDGNNSGNPLDEESSGESLSAALVEDLTAHRTAALRAALALRPDVALVAITHSLALQVCYDVEAYEVGSALSLNTEKGGCDLECHAKGIEKSVPSVKAQEVRSHWMTRVPAQPSDLWKWLLGQDQSVVLELLAFCVGQTVYAVRLSHYGAGLAERGFAASDLLAEALNLDMADWWTATGASYLGRVKKDLVLEALKEGTGETNVDELRKLKKTDLVSTAEARLVGKRWLPAILKG